jgi:hypothetical protein
MLSEIHALGIPPIQMAVVTTIPLTSLQLMHVSRVELVVMIAPNAPTLEVLIPSVTHARGTILAQAVVETTILLHGLPPRHVVPVGVVAMAQKWRYHNHQPGVSLGTTKNGLVQLQLTQLILCVASKHALLAHKMMDALTLEVSMLLVTLAHGMMLTQVAVESMILIHGLLVQRVAPVAVELELKLQLLKIHQPMIQLSKIHGLMIHGMISLEETIPSLTLLLITTALKLSSQVI